MSTPKKNPAKDRRNFYRILYPEQNCPKALISGETFKVVDVSEEGIRFTSKKFTGFILGAAVTGSLTFQDGESMLLFATVRRVSEDGEIGLALKRPIPLRKIMEEQRRLHEKFPKKPLR